MHAIRIILVCVFAAVVYGIVHDQFTVRLSLEYFTVGHPPLFTTQSPTLLALGWGIVATWWLALPMGVLVAIAARLGARPKLTTASLQRPLVQLLLLMGMTATAAAFVGWWLADRGFIWLVPRLADQISPERHTRFLAALWAHNASYASGIVGSIVLAVVVWRRRRRIAISTDAAT